MSYPRTYSGDLANLPKALSPLCRQLQWVAWRWVRVNDNWTKPPFRVDQPDRHAANNDPATWGSHYAAVAVVLAGKGHGIGFALTKTKIGAVDLDCCRDAATGRIDTWAQELLDKAPDAYHEVTVSGQGLRIIGTTAGAPVHRKFSIPAGRERAAVEVYRGATRYITISGLEISRCAKLPNIDVLIDSIAVENEQKNGADARKEEKKNGFDAAGIFVDDIDELIKNGAPETQRSEAFARVVWSLASQGQTIDEIEKKLRKYPNGIAQKYVGRLHKEVERCYEKWRRARPTKNEDEGASWAYPDLSFLDDRRSELPPLPLDVLSAGWQEWATNAAHGAGTTVDHVLVPLFGVASSLVGTARRLQASTSWTQPFTLWIAIVGNSGTGKTPGLNVSQRTLARVERNRRHLIGKLRRAHETKIENAKVARKQWQEKVKEAVDAGRKVPDMPPEAEVPEPFEAPRLFLSNVTIEKLAVLLQARPQGMLVTLDELAGLFLNLSRYSGGTDREFWLEAWNGEAYRVERMGRPPVDLEHLLVGLAGGLQPDKLARSFDGDADGLYARVLFSWPAEAPYRPLTDVVHEMDPELENVFIRLIDLAESEEGKLIVRNVTLTNDARDVFEVFRQLVHRKKDGLDGREREWWVKTPAHVLRLAGTLAYLDWARETAGTTMPEPGRIETRFVTAAVRLVTEYFWPHARAALRQIGLTERHTKARKVLLWLRAERSPGSELSLKDIRRDALGQSLDAEATTKLIEALVQAGWLRRVPIEKDGRGRTPHRWSINPLLWGAENAGSAGNSPLGRGATAAQPEIRFSALPAFSAPTQDIDGDHDREEATWTV